MSLISLEHVSKTYPNGHKALNDVTLSVNPGEVLTIIGPSGCGKSTLLRTVNGLEPVDSGQILVNGRDVTAGSTKLLSLIHISEPTRLYPKSRMPSSA